MQKYENVKQTTALTMEATWKIPFCETFHWSWGIF